jgi:NADH:ubiquinone oxidoreductase subunit 6 (subunit J)|tara:strand:+ start:144 stop:473 length:330 start_codon:yes stop_codon:yes gene_type:complete
MEILINWGIILTYIMVAFAAFAAIGFGIKQMMQKTNNAKKTLYTIGGLFIIIILSYITASDEVLGSYEKYEITASTAKKVGMGLTTFYILAISAIGAVLYSELSKVFTK